MMTPEAVQAHRNATEQFVSIAALICHKIFGRAAYMSHAFDSAIADTVHISIYPLGPYMGPEEALKVPKDCFTSIEKLDAFCAAYVPKHIQKERDEFERLRVKFCEQPCVNH